MFLKNIKIKKMLLAASEGPASACNCASKYWRWSLHRPSIAKWAERIISGLNSKLDRVSKAEPNALNTCLCMFTKSKQEGRICNAWTGYALDSCVPLHTSCAFALESAWLWVCELINNRFSLMAFGDLPYIVVLIGRTHAYIWLFSQQYQMCSFGLWLV